LSVCPAGKTVQSTGEDIGDIWNVALSPPAEEERPEDIGEIYNLRRQIPLPDVSL
jgi:hypothetical protein